MESKWLVYNAQCTTCVNYHSNALLDENDEILFQLVSAARVYRRYACEEL